MKSFGKYIVRRTFLIFLLLLVNCITANAADLLDVYEQALKSDPIFQQAIAQHLSDHENVPIRFSDFLPTVEIASTSFTNQTIVSGQDAGHALQKGYDVSLIVEQSIIHYGKWANYLGAKALAKKADAIIKAEEQALIVRVAQAYFTILQDQDTLRFQQANKFFYQKQLEQLSQQHQVGLKKITDRQTAQAAYDLSLADYIAAETQLMNDKENLRVLTGNLYSALSHLRKNIPYDLFNRVDLETWIERAKKSNYAIQSAQQVCEIAKQNRHYQFAKHLPDIHLKGIYNISHSSVMSDNPTSPVLPRAGSLVAHGNRVELTANVSIFSGGEVTAQTRQAHYDYQKMLQNLQQVIRVTIHSVRQHYLSLYAAVRKIQADVLTIQSAKSALQSMQIQYQVGLVTLTNVLHQQEKVLNAELQYSADRYSSIIQLLLLKQAVGTLSVEDIGLVNSWLEE